MITYEQALKAVLKHTFALRYEKIPIEEAAGRVIKEDVYSKIDMPPFDKSAMDGYAVNASDLKKTPLKLKCVGLIQAGETFKKKIKRGECVKIMTGAPLPENTDSVLMVENACQSGESVEALTGVGKGENVCPRGEDVKRGQKILKKNRMLGPAQAAVLAAAGRRFVKVSAKPDVAILNTGGEIVPQGNRLGKNKIYNSNGPMLQALLKADGIEARCLGIAKDQVSELKKKIIRGLSADVLLISGGVSMGDFDLIPQVLEGFGVKRVFHKVNIKPGKPFLFGIKNRGSGRNPGYSAGLRNRDKTLIFGIPGNPAANFLVYLIFVRPVLMKMSGQMRYLPVFEEGILGKTLRHKPGRRHFVPVKISPRGSDFYLIPVDNHGSADTLALSQAEGFAVADARAALINTGTRVRFIRF